MDCYPEPDSYIRNKIMVELDLSNYATKKQLEYVTIVDASGLAPQKDFIDLKDEVDKLDITELVNVSTSLNNSETKVNDLDVGMLKIVKIR